MNQGLSEKTPAALSTDLRGVWWHEYGVWYDHHLPPNSPLPDEVEEHHCPTYCDARKAPIIGDTPAWKLASASRSARDCVQPTPGADAGPHGSSTRMFRRAATRLAISQSRY
jgi:hypothetical protein